MTLGVNCNAKFLPWKFTLGDLIQFDFRVVFDKKPCYLYPDILRYLDNRLTSQN